MMMGSAIVSTGFNLQATKSGLGLLVAMHNTPRLIQTGTPLPTLYMCLHDVDTHSAARRRIR